MTSVKGCPFDEPGTLNPSPVFVPLGTRCSAAGIIQQHFKKREMSLPFDWIDTPVKNLIQFINIDREMVTPIVKNYFLNQVNTQTHRHPDGTWFPHDLTLMPDGGYRMIVENILEKYIRRFNRLHDLFYSGRNLVFFNVNAHVNQDNANKFVDLRRILYKKCKGRTSFVSINLVEEDFYDVSYDHYHFHIPLISGTTGQEFAIWEKQIYDRIVNSPAKTLFV